MSALQQLCAAYGAIKGKVVLGIHFDATITDTKGHALTIVGATASTAQAKSGTYSGYFSGSGQYVETASSPDFVFGNSDFTIEMWIMFAASPPAGGARYFMVGKQIPGLDQYYTLQQTSGGLIQFNSPGTPSISLTSGVAPAASVWHHVAITRKAGVFKLFLNGVPTSGVSSTVNYTTNMFCVGGANQVTGTSVFHAGYMDDVRVTSGEAIYDLEFSGNLPAAPFVDS